MKKVIEEPSMRFHSVDPGKLTMVPYFAEICAERISLAG
jgi:hypothetical protein